MAEAREIIESCGPSWCKDPEFDAVFRVEVVQIVLDTLRETEADRDAWKKRAEQAERFDATNAAVIRSMSEREKQAERDLAEAVGLLKPPTVNVSQRMAQAWMDRRDALLSRLDKRGAQGGA